MNVTKPRLTKTSIKLAVRPPLAVPADAAPLKASKQCIDGVEQKPRVKGNDGPGQTAPVGPVVTEPSSPANAIEKEVLQTLQGGYGAVATKAIDIKDMLTRSRMVQEAKDRLDVQVEVLEALAGGKPGLQAKTNEIKQLMMVALLDERGSKKLELELAVLGNVTKDFAPLEKRLTAIDSLTTRALLTADASMSLSAEHRALKAFIHGGARIDGQIAAVEQQLAAGTTPAMKDALTLDQSALLGVKGGLTGVRERVQEVKNLMMVARFDVAGLASVTRELNTLEALEKALSSFERRANQIG